MHIALKKIEFELNRFLPKGSDEQVESIYFLAKEEYDLRMKEKTSFKQNDIINNGIPNKKLGRTKK